MSDAPIIVEVTDKVSPAIGRKLRDIATQARTAQTQVDKLKASLAAIGRGNPLTRLQTEMRNVNTETLKAAQSSQRLATEQARTATTSQRLATEQQRTAQASHRVREAQERASIATQRLNVEQQRAVVAKNNAAMSALRLTAAQNRATAAATRHSAAASGLNTVLGALGITAGVVGVVMLGRSMARQADIWSDLNSRVQLATRSQAEAESVMARLSDMSRRTYSSLQNTATGWVQNATALRELGMTTEQTLDFQEAMNNALVVSGLRGERAASVQDALTRAMALGVLRGDQLNSVIMNGGRVAELLAAELGVNVNQLRALGSQGKITGDVISRALVGNLEMLREEADSMAATIEDAVIIWNDAWLRFVGGTDQATGASAALASAIIFLADNIERLAVYGATAAALYAGYYVTSLIAAAVATGTLSGALVVLRTALIRTGIGAIVVLVGELVYRFFEASSAVGGVGRMFQIMGDTGKAALDWVIAGGYSMVDAFRGIGLTIAAVFTGVWASIQRGFANLMAALQSGINTMITSLNDAFTFDVVNPITGNVMASMNGLGIQMTNFAEGYIKAADDSAAAAEGLSNRANDAFRSMGDRFSDLRNPLDVYSEGMATARAETEAANAAAGELESTLRGATEPTAGAGGGGRGTQGATASLRAYLDEMDREMALLKLLPKEREIEAAVQEKVNKLKEKGITLSAQEIDLLRERTAALREANAVAEQEAALMNATVYAREGYIQQLQAIQNLLNNPESGFTNGDALNQLAQTEIGAYLEHLPEMVNARVEQFGHMYEQINALRQADLISEQSASAAKMQIWAAEQKAKTDVFANFFGGIAQLASSENEKLARIGKAAAITQTVIQTYQSATAAYASMAGIPVIGPALGVAAAAAAIAAGMANVAAIRAQSTSTGAGYMSGGYTGDLPRNAVAGAVHGREYVMDAATTSRVGVDDLNALRRGAATVQRPDSEAAGAGQRVSAGAAPAAAGANPAPQVNTRIVNVIDPAVVGDYMATPEGESVVLNVIRRNSDQLKQVVANG